MRDPSQRVAKRFKVASYVRFTGGVPLWVLCVAYDLRQPGRNYNDFYEYLKSYGTWCHAAGSIWFVKTDKSPETVVTEARRYLDSNDAILVVRAAAPGSWVGLSDAISKWFKKQLT